jgi:hypothetical protein
VTVFIMNPNDFDNHKGRNIALWTSRFSQIKPPKISRDCDR